MCIVAGCSALIDLILESGGGEGAWRVVIEQSQRNGVEVLAFTSAVADIGTKAG